MSKEAPTTTKEVNVFLGRINACDRKLERIDTTRKRRISAVNDKAKKAKEPVLKEKKDLTSAVQNFLKKNKVSLIRKWGKKSLQLLQGTIGWVVHPMSISVAKGQDEHIAKKLWKKRSTRRFVRRKVVYELDKDALLKEPKKAHAIEGVTVKNIKRNDSLFIKPGPKED